MDPDPDLILQFFALNAFVLGMSFGNLIFGIIIIFLLLMCSALISGSEIAFFSITVNDVQQLEEEKSYRAKNILLLRDRPRKLLATILISNNFINIGIVVISDFLLRFIFPQASFWGPAEWLVEKLPFLKSLISSTSLANGIHFIISVIGVTFLLVLFGEVAPKVYARYNNVALAKFMAGPLLFLEKVFSPLSILLVNGTHFIENRLSRHTNGASTTSKEDVAQAIELTVQSGTDANQEIDILKSIVKFGDVSVKQIMCSRVDVIAVDFRVQFMELLTIVRQSGYSRIPVYENDFDTVTGILYVKDLIPYLDKDDNFEWQKLIRTNLLYTPESKKINELLKEFQIQHLHMAIVVDEYGGSSGIVTLEDIMEEVIGEIRDETDLEEEIDFEKLDNYNYIFEGKTLINDVCKIIGVDTQTFDGIRGDADTLAGMVLELTREFPKEKSEITFGGYKLKNLSVSKRRIQKIQITIPKDAIQKAFS